MDSPRGRIFLMKSALEGRLRLADALPYVDRCLGCMACVTACPSGVEYGELLTPFRAHAESRRHRPMIDRLRRHVVLETLPYPGRFRLAARFGQLTRPLAPLVPSAFRAMLDLLPPQLAAGAAASRAHASRRTTPRARRAAGGLRAAGARPRDQPRGAASAVESRGRSRGASRSGVLWCPASARRRRCARARVRVGQPPCVSGGRGRDHYHRFGLWLRDARSIPSP